LRADFRIGVSCEALRLRIATKHTGNKPVVGSAWRFQATRFVFLNSVRRKPMPRVKRGTKRRSRRKKYLKRTKGFFLTKSKLYQSAQEAANRADRYAKRDRRVKKRQYRRLWIQRVGAAARQNGLSYGRLIHGLKAAGVSIDRKVLADIAVHDAAGFAQLAEKAKAFAPKPAAKKA
jgi:large subunit ribosomal protein L20